MATQPESADPGYEPLPEFSWLERRADGILFLLVPTLCVVDGVIFAFGLGWGWLLLALAGGLALGFWLGQALGTRLGRGYVGGMFLPRWFRCLCLLGALIALVGWPTHYIAQGKHGTGYPARLLPARSGERK